LKILFSNKIFFEQKYGGISRYFYTVFEKFIEKNITFKVIAPIYKNLYLKSLNASYKKGIFIPRYPLNYSLKKLNNFISNKFINSCDYNILHDTYFSSHILDIKNKKKIVTIHDLIHEKFSKYYNSRDIISTKREIFKKIDKFICVSESTKEDLLKIYDIQENKISVIYHGSDHLDKISVDTSKKKFEFLKKINKPFILYVGNRYRYKNFQTLVRAFNNSSLIKNNFQIIFFGGESISKKESQLYDELKLSKKILHLRGDDEILKHLYFSAQVMVSTSVDEGFGLNILEALRYGCIVLAKDIKVFREIYNDKLTYFNDEESLQFSLEKCLQLKKHQNETKNNKFFEKFTWEKTCAKMLQVYENC